MKKLILILLLTSFFWVLTAATTNKKEVKKMKTLVKKEDKTIRITSLYFPGDEGRWTDRILSGFDSEILKTGLSVNLSHVNYRFKNMKDEDLIKEVINTKPDYVYLPDDLLYKKFAKILNQKTGAPIVFSTFYSSKEDLNIVKDQAGVYADAPLGFLIKNIEKISKEKVKHISLIGGPHAKAMVPHIKSKVSTDVTFSSYITTSWDEYVKLCKSESQKGHTLMPLAPFDVKTVENKDVEDFQFKSLMLSLESVTLGYGGIKNYSRTLSMAIVPEILGKNTATALYKKIIEGSSTVTKYTSFDLRINNKNIMKLNYKVPEDLMGFVSL